MLKKRLFTRLSIVMLLAILLLPKIFTIAQASEMGETPTKRKGIVTATGLNFREEATTESEIIMVLPQGTRVTILEDVGEWLRAEYEDREGYLFESYVDAILSTGMTTASSLNVRSEPTTESQSLDLINKGSRVFIIEEIETENKTNPVWLKIAYLDGSKTGYVSKRYVKILTDSEGMYRNVGIITAKVSNVRETYNARAKTVGKIYEGDFVTILDEKETNTYDKKWYKIQFDGKTGWIAERNLEILEWNKEVYAKTSSPSSGRNRNFNMYLACSTLSGTIVYPGEKFSWVETMGSCSAAKGYLTATVYVNGEISEGAGGGVCQVSTTFNMAIKKLGIETNAHQHSLPVSYAKRSDEASVSYPYVDFSFKNTLDTPILVEFVASGGTVTCNVYVAK